MKLPDLPQFKDFNTVGPSGTHQMDINGRAAAIECYLDVGPNAFVRWNNYNREPGVYHGELSNKGDAIKAFYSLSEPLNGYDSSKIKPVVEMIIAECIRMRESPLLNSFQLERFLL